MSTYTLTDVMRKLSSLESQLGEQRRMLTRLVDAQRSDEAQGPVHLEDGRLFLPGSGPLGSERSDEARAVEAELDAADVDPEVPADGPAAERLARVTRLAERTREDHSS